MIGKAKKINERERVCCDLEKNCFLGDAEQRKHRYFDIWAYLSSGNENSIEPYEEVCHWYPRFKIRGISNV